MKTVHRFAALTAVLACTPVVLSAQVVQQSAVPKDSVGGIMALIGAQRSSDEILQMVSIDCVTFPFDALDAGAKRKSGYENLTEGLMRRCSRLRLETDPAGAVLKVNGRELGTTSALGDLWWVDPGKKVEVSATLGSSTITRQFDFPADKMVQTKFSLPKDTISLPPVRTPRQVATDLGLISLWRPPAGGPVMPVKPAQMGAFPAGLLWGIVGGAIGAAAAEFVPTLGCSKSYTVPSSGAYVRGVKYAGGTTVNLGGGVPCVGMVAGGSFGFMFIAGASFKHSGNKGRTAAYETAVNNFPATRQAWEDEQLNAFISKSAEVMNNINADESKRRLAVQDNQATRERNSRLPDPTYILRDMPLNPGGRHPAVVATRSDVDQVVPKTDVKNPNALAIVIGNRDYQADNVPHVDYAIEDAKSIRRYLIDAFGFDSTRVVLDTNARTSDMLNLFGNQDATSGLVSDRTKTRDSVDVFVFYSGHGAPELGQRYLVPVDADFDRLRNTGYSTDKLYKNLSQLKVRSMTVVIDACFSGLSEGGAVQQGRSGADDLDADVETVAGASTAVFTAVTAKETARWRKDQGHGLFTYFFLKGLQGEADANHDNSITAGEMADYLTANVPRYAVEELKGANQHPQSKIANRDRVILKLGGSK